MRNGSYIRALGRQSFEPSQPTSDTDSAGSSTCEQSQEMQRRLIKAQNDVLATVGVCRRDTKQNQVLSEAIIQENEVGLLVGAVDLTITYLATWPLIGIRNRLQTYRTYEGLRYRDVLLLTCRSNGILDLLSGMPAHLCYQLVNVVRDHIQAKLIRHLSTKPLFRDPKTNKPRKKLLYAVNRCFSTLSWFLVYPLYQHSILQSLHLLPPTSLLPSLYSFIPFSSQSPLALPSFPGPVLSLSALAFLASQAANSYFLSSFFQQYSCGLLQLFFFSQIRRVIPHPTNPDLASIAGALDEELDRAHWDTDIQVPPPQQDETVAIMIEQTSSEGDRSRQHFTATLQFDEPQPLPRGAGWTEEEERPLTGMTDGEPPPTQHRVTRLSLHPADVAASHVADGVATAFSSVFESAVMRTIARSFLLRQGVSPGVVNMRVFSPWEFRGNVGLIAKALAGEWGLMWLLFEGSYFASAWIGVTWFGYPAEV
ncbi:hypothetical protein L873DRAFT_1780128 [Choiromyces venosus 120613-1]|uniref:Uncharacterized protein n=1 Tax=Choiromyces venosus 120613-1 TaxID=1336337 RepID=A0A3N4J1D6_9PEZI|nr:hypothetical protein L873DRAFT_1780128 [Choiromyces venosus 120613-1]